MDLTEQLTHTHTHTHSHSHTLTHIILDFPVTSPQQTWVSVQGSSLYSQDESELTDPEPTAASLSRVSHLEWDRSRAGCSGERCKADEDHRTGAESRGAGAVDSCSPGNPAAPLPFPCQTPEASPVLPSKPLFHPSWFGGGFCH